MYPQTPLSLVTEGFNLLKMLHTHGFVISAFDLEETCCTFSQLKPL